MGFVLPTETLFSNNIKFDSDKFNLSFEYRLSYNEIKIKRMKLFFYVFLRLLARSFHVLFLSCYAAVLCRSLFFKKRRENSISMLVLFSAKWSLRRKQKKETTLKWEFSLQFRFLVEKMCAGDGNWIIYSCRHTRRNIVEEKFPWKNFVYDVFLSVCQLNTTIWKSLKIDIFVFWQKSEKNFLNLNNFRL